MGKLFLKMGFYGFLIVLSLEVWVRIFYLGKDSPTRYVDEKKVEKWVPNQSGFSVTGNRRQNFSEYHINNSGFNSYREFAPTEEKIEIALVGDSFIEGFHQPYHNSIGRKIENRLAQVDVYEYGYAGYDMADQLHLINSYEDQFKLIDMVILGIKFENDLQRDKYEVVPYRMALESPINRLMKKSKLIVYAQSIGAISGVRRFFSKIISLGKSGTPKASRNIVEKEVHKKYIHNLESLMTLYGFDKSRYHFLLDETITPSIFMDYLTDNGYNYIPIGKALQEAKVPTTLVYDRHWNNNGRKIVAKSIADYYRSYKGKDRP